MVVFKAQKRLSVYTYDDDDDSYTMRAYSPETLALDGVTQRDADVV